MSDLWWPGDERAGDLLSDATLLAAMVEVEQAWLDALAEAGTAPRADLSRAVAPEDVVRIAEGAEETGNPVVGLVKVLRERSGNTWVHRGLTSQDVLDSAVMLCLRAAAGKLTQDQSRQALALAGLAETHRGSLMPGRTLTQSAVPITFGLKAAVWLGGVLDAAERVSALRFPAQFGGAAGTLSAATAIAGSPAAARALCADAASRLGLDDTMPWHTSRGPVTTIADALVAATDSAGRIAGDVVTLARPEIGELREPAGRGGSSTMPHKANPVLSILIRRTAMTAPQLGATLHLAASLADDERPDGAWHAEWASLRDLGRRTVVAASQTAELLEGLVVDTDAMRTHAATAWAELTAERDVIAAFAAGSGSDDDYLGATDILIDSALDRAHTFLEQS